jgi:hypothetical protein
VAKHDQDKLVRLDLNNTVFQENLLSLQKPDRHSALDSLNKIRQMTLNQIYRDGGLEWEKSLASSRQQGSMQFIRSGSPKPDGPPPIVMVILYVF